MDFYLYKLSSMPVKRFPPKYLHLASIFKTKTTTTNVLGFDQLGFCFILKSQHRFTSDSRPKYFSIVSIIIWARCKNKIQEPALKRAARAKSCVSTKEKVSGKEGVWKEGVWQEVCDSAAEECTTPLVPIQGAEGLCGLQECKEGR